MTLSNFLVISALLFAIGAYGVLSRRNAIAVLMGVELMLNAANLNFLAFWRYLAPTSMEPQVFVLIGITIAAAEAAVGLAVVLNVYRDFGTVNVEEIDTMKG
jgi:NADH:ubiquinone oxidoreductase subunit K